MIYMKRLFAILVDLFVAQLIFKTYTSFFTLPDGNFSRFLYDISSNMFFILYNWVFDFWFDGLTFGKRLCSLKIIFKKDNRFLFGFLHGFLRWLFCLIFPFTIVYYFFIGKGKMPYDDWLDIALEDKNVTDM